jgi:exodeoxyribonuclease III
VLSLLTLNLQAAALPRAGRLLTWLHARNDHAVVLTETSNGPGTAHLLDQCRQAGMFVEHRRSTDGDRGCAVISRIAATAQPALTAGISLPGRAAAVTLHTEPATTLLGIYVPSSDRAPAKISKKQAFLASILEAIADLPEQQRRHLILAGDYNVISRHHQPRYSVFRAFEYAFIEQLTDLGMTDIHQHLHPGTQVHSWYGRGGNGYRFDYFHTGAAITADTTECAHLEEARTGKLTDHDAVTLTVARTVTRQLPTISTDTAATTLL